MYFFAVAQVTDAEVKQNGLVVRPDYNVLHFAVQVCDVLRMQVFERARQSPADDLHLYFRGFRVYEFDERSIGRKLWNQVNYVFFQHAELQELSTCARSNVLLNVLMHNSF